MNSPNTDATNPERQPGPQLVPRPPGHRLGRPAPWHHLAPPRRRPTLDEVVEAVRTAPEPTPWPGTAPPGHQYPAAVLVALYERSGDPYVILTRRAWHMRSHKGDVSFPGGRMEPGETHVETALREAAEEVALDPSGVEILGELDPLFTFSSSAGIAPVVGVISGTPELSPHPDEVDAVLHVPLTELLDPNHYHEELWEWEGSLRPLWFFDLDGDTVWGATAAILRNLLSLSTGVRRGHPYAGRLPRPG